MEIEMKVRILRYAELATKDLLNTLTDEEKEEYKHLLTLINKPHHEIIKLAESDTMND